MGSVKDQLLDIEAERFDEWLEENHPDVVPGSEEWEHAANLYCWEQEALADLLWSTKTGHRVRVFPVSVF